MGTRTRDIVFLCLAVAFLGTSIWLVRRQAPRTTVAPAPPAAAQAAPQTPRPQVAGPTQPKAPGAPVAQPARNPFATPPGGLRPTETPKRPPLNQPAAPPAVPASPAPAPTPAPLAPAPAPVAPNAALPPLAQVSAPVVKTGPMLSGVIGGSTKTPTAIIRDGNQRYFAQQGDKIAAGRYTVQSVTSQTVVLVSAQGKLILKMGGS